MQLFAFKQPNFMHLITPSWSPSFTALMARTTRHDVYVKKLVANLTVGLFEKCVSQKTAGFLFQDYEVCKYDQAQHRGSVHSVKKLEDVSEIIERSPVGLDDGFDMVGPVVSVKIEFRGSLYFILF